MSDTVILAIFAAAGAAGAGVYFLLLWLQGKAIVARRDRAMRLVFAGMVLRLGLVVAGVALALSLNYVGGMIALGAFLLTRMLGIGLMAWPQKGEHGADS